MAKRMRAKSPMAATATTPSTTTGDRDTELLELTIAPMSQDDTNGADADDRSVSARGRGGATPQSEAPKSKPPAAAAGADSKHVMLPAFLSKTFEIFSMPEFASVCGWNANGDTIIVSQLEAFVALVLPRFFKHRNFPSFVRQLNLYGFHKTVLDSKRLEFQHPYFKRDRPDLLHYIKRKVSSGGASTQQQQQQQQQLVSTTVQNSRLEAHREISDSLLREMKELRLRSETMEKRLRELEIDNAIVRSDNVKLWKHLETAKDKQLIMQEKLKKIMWILFQIYRGKQGIPKLSSTDAGDVISEDYINSSMLGAKEFREVLRYLAMDEPPLLPRSSTSAVEVPSQGSRKRKFVEVASDSPGQFANQFYPFELPSVVEVSSPSVGTSSAMTVAAAPSTDSSNSNNNVLSIFSPTLSSVPRPDFGGGDLSALFPNGVPSSLTNYDNATALAAAATAAVTGRSHSPANGTANQLDLIDDDLPLLSDSENYTFGDSEEHVMKKLEDFETSLLDEYDVGCLDTLLQQLKSSAAGKPAADVSVIDPEEIFIGGPDDGSPRNA